MMEALSRDDLLSLPLFSFRLLSKGPECTRLILGFTSEVYALCFEHTSMSLGEEKKLCRTPPVRPLASVFSFPKKDSRWALQRLHQVDKVAKMKNGA